MRLLFMLVALGVAMLCAETTNAQTLTVIGLDGKKEVISQADLAKLSHVKLSVNQHGKDHAFEGVPLTVLLQQAGAPTGEKLRGVDLTDVVLITARDGYQVTLALAETDPAMSAHSVIVADKMDGKGLDEHDGPIRLIVEADRRPARAVRMLDSIKIIRLGAAKAKPGAK